MYKFLTSAFLIGTCLLVPVSYAQSITERLSSHSGVHVEKTIERLSKVNLPTEGKFILVNIASQTLTAYKDGNVEFESKVIVGTRRSRTPQLFVEVSHLEINPYWYTPASIASRKGWMSKKDTDPDYFKRNGISVVDNGEGGLRFIQKPGDENVLGPVKIKLLGGGNIMLHGTNEPEKFDKEIRTFSSGCVRVQDIEKLATWIMDEQVDPYIETGKTIKKNVNARIPVLIGYFTAWLDANDQLVVYNDVYGYDNGKQNHIAKKVEFNEAVDTVSNDEADPT